MALPKINIFYIYILYILMFASPGDSQKVNGSFLQFERHLKRGHPHHTPNKIWRKEEIEKFKISKRAFSVEKQLSNLWTKENTTKLSPTSSRRGYPLRFQQRTEPTINQQSFSDSSQGLIKALCNMGGKTKMCYTHGQSVCRCRGELADCSGKRYVPNISYIPKLPPEIKCLLFQYNNAAYLDESYFANVSDFKVIDFSYNRLRTVSKNTFARFTGHLQYLILNSNSLTYSNIRNVLSHPPSTRLDLMDAGISQPIPKGYFRPFAKLIMPELYLDFNYLHKLDLSEFSVLKNLKFLSVRNCTISEIKSDFMPSLEFLNLDNNPISKFPDTCRNEWIDKHNGSDRLSSTSAMSVFPKLKLLLLGNNKIKLFPHHTELCLPELETLNMYLSNISTFHSHSLQSLSSLIVLSLDRMKSNVVNIEINAFSSKTLKNLHLSKNHIIFSSENISDFMFQDCPSLEVLHLDHNSFANASEASFKNLLSNLSKLTSLYMGSSQIRFIPSEALSNLLNVVELYLYINEITSIPPSAFDAMLSLIRLNLNQNRIATVGPRSFSPTTIQRLKEIDMNRNDFQCNCDLLWFQSWLKRDGPTKFYGFPKGYNCANRPGTLVSEFVLSKQACLYGRKTYILFTVCLSILIVSFIVFSIGYRYRWHIRLALYQWKSIMPTADAVQDHFQEKTHDVFIVYCNDDSSWVLDKLLNHVEDQWGLKAFVHERDFIAGRWIMDNIVTAMNSCRHILVVLSPRFTESQWCNMELMLCQSHVIEHDLPSLLVVELEPMEPHQMSAVVRALRSTTTFLEWPADPRMDAVFWTKLERCARSMKSSNSNRR